ncbi:MAG TPA: hypothetical protein PLZ15_14110 [Melioribacteraceae bacterium]|nr:hypothetical protein [Melioribacteraceae bacterium]
METKHLFSISQENLITLSQENLIHLHLKRLHKSQTWLAKRLSTRKRKYYQPEISRALAGRDPLLLQKIVDFFSK